MRREAIEASLGGERGEEREPQRGEGSGRRMRKKEGGEVRETHGSVIFGTIEGIGPLFIGSGLTPEHR